MNLEQIRNIFCNPVELTGNFIEIEKTSKNVNQQQTNEAFSEKWKKVKEKVDRTNPAKFQRDWYLKLYGFETEANLKSFLATKNVIFDAGCGLGEKTAWHAELAPHALVIGMDFSEAVHLAAENFGHIPNLFFARGDIAKTGICKDVIDYTYCDQVIMHTEDPDATFKHLTDITAHDGSFSCYVYAKKALPRELLDDHFRKATHDLSNNQIWELSEQLTELGKRLSALNVKIESPEIPLLGIKGGEYDIQRFIYWNFMKCFWSEFHGYESSVSANFDWYSPSNARRFSKDEFLKLVEDNQLTVHHFHSEPACYSGRFKKD